MSARHRALVLLLLVSLLVTGCGGVAPTATSAPLTATPIALRPTNSLPPPTATPAPPTPTPLPPTPTATPPPPPTATPVPPTAVPTATPTPAPLLLFENSPQSFGRTETFQVGLGDLDGDGDLDAVLANMAANDSRVWFNDGGVQGGTPGQFVDSGQKLTQQGHGLDLGDLDGDGDLDIFMTCAHYRGGGGGWSKRPSRVYLNDGQGTFEDSGQDLGDTELSGNGVNLIDLDGDGDLDAHVVYYEVDGMADRVYLNDGAGRFTDSGLALDEEEIAWGDLDADGDVDMLAKAYGQGYRVLLNDGTGHFVTGWQMEDGQAIIGDLALADLDGDGDLDALVANGFRSEGSYPTRLLWNDGTGQFADSGQELNKTMGAKFTVGDLDRDGSPDVFVSNADQRPGEAWLNDGTGRLVDSGLRLQSPSRLLATWPSLGDLDGDGDLDLFQAGFEGKAEVWLNTTPLPAADSGGGLIAFVSTRDGNDEIYVMPAPGSQAQVNADGSDQRNLSQHPASDDDPRWSPDGSQIAFSSDRSGNYDVYTMDADGTNLQRLTQNPAVDAQPAWSPDGTQIAFVSLRDGNAEIYVMDVDGSDLRRVTHTEADEFEFDWSPDGTRIVFALSEGAHADIYVMNSDGSERQQLTGTGAQDFYPRWSPDGGQIGFLSTRDGGLEEIYVMDADGGNQRRLTTNDAFDGAPSWSPDGTRLIFASDRNGNPELYVMKGDGTDVQRLTDNSAADRKPAWQPLGATGDGTSTWIRTFEGPGYGAFFDAILTEDGNVLAVGATNHLHVPPYSGDALLVL
jgi:Tol biopolymer transport system component